MFVRSRRYERGSSGRQAKTHQDAPSDVWICDRCQDPHSVAATRTLERVHLEHPLKKLGPAVAAPSRVRGRVSRGWSGLSSRALTSPTKHWGWSGSARAAVFPGPRKRERSRPRSAAAGALAPTSAAAACNCPAFPVSAAFAEPESRSPRPAFVGTTRSRPLAHEASTPWYLT